MIEKWNRDLKNIESYIPNERLKMQEKESNLEILQRKFEKYVFQSKEYEVYYYFFKQNLINLTNLYICIG